MTFTQMQYFEAVCKYGSYTKAANELFVSQPAVSQAVRDLEHECGLKLFERKGNGLLRTEAADRLLAEVQIVLTQMNGINRMIEEGTLKQEVLRIGLSTLSSSACFPQICAAFHKKYPEVRIITYEDVNKEVFHLLDMDKVDAIITSPRQQDLEGKKYLLYPLTASDLVYCVSVDHPWAGRDFVTYEEIAAEPLILMTEQYSAGRTVLEKFKELGLEPNIILRTSQVYTVERFVEAGAAAGFLPAHVAERSPHIVPIPYNPDSHAHPVQLVIKKQERLSRTLEHFLETALELYL